MVVGAHGNPEASLYGQDENRTDYLRNFMEVAQPGDFRSSQGPASHLSGISAQQRMQPPEPKILGQTNGQGSTTDKEGGSADPETERDPVGADLKRSGNNYTGLNQPRYVDSSHADEEDRIYRDLTEESSP